MPRLTRYHRLGAALLLLTAAMALGILQAVDFRRELAREHAYLTREVQEGLSALQRDLMTAGHMAGDVPEHSRDVREYFAARRDVFAPVLWLGRVSAESERPAVLLDSAALHGYDPRRDVGTATALTAAAQGGLAVAIPTGHHSRASLALVVTMTANDASVLVALLDVDALLENALQAHIRGGVPAVLRMSWGGQPIGTWPQGTEPAPDATADVTTVGLGSEEFTLAFAAPGWPAWLRAVLPLPLTMVLTVAVVLALARFTRPTVPMAPPPPADLLPMAPSPSLASPPHRDRLWHLGELAASLAHDLGQPLNVIRLNAEAAADSLAGGRLDDARLRRTLDTVVEQTVRARALFDAVVAASRRPTETATALDPRETMRRALAEQLAPFKRQGIRLRWHADREVPTVAGHPPHFAAALRHLLVNAAEAVVARQMEHGSGGTVWVECRRSGGGVDLVVADDGPGFPLPVLAALADPSALPLRRGKGCGLGLTIISGVVAEMGGTLSVINTQPGTRVTVHLPAWRRTLLLTDDDEAATASLAEALTSRGWQVRVAHGGNQAWAMFRDTAADAVVTDLHMADGDGWRLIERLRALAPDLPIVAVTAANDDEARRAVAVGATIVVRKPVAASEIAAELREMLSDSW